MYLNTDKSTLNVKFIALKCTLFENAIANFVSDKVNICIANSGSKMTKDSEISWNMSLQIF